MAKIRNPISFSKQFNVNSQRIEQMGLLNPVLNVDTKLFIDPVLLGKSRNPIISKVGAAKFNSHFEEVIKLLRASKKPGDVAWRAAKSRLNFPEIAGTCLGYGSSGIRGSAFGPGLTERLLHTAKEIVDLGITDPDLFKLLPLLEEGVGPDLISDMTTNVILDELASLTASACSKLGVPSKQYMLAGSKYTLPTNPTQSQNTPVVLVPRDILRTLPVASDWSEVADAADANAAIRKRVNRLIGNIWSAKTRRDKARLRAAALANKAAFDALLELIRTVNIKPYNLEQDPEGIAIWRNVHETITSRYPLKLDLAGSPDKNKAIILVRTIVDHFSNLIERKGLWKLLWRNGSPHHEKVAQMVFFAIADAYCKSNNLDVTPEADTGTGPVDFKFAGGYDIRILVEVKLSTNPKLVAGYEKQLEAYKQAESPVSATYLVVNVGGIGRKGQRLLALKNERDGQNKSVSEVVFVDARRKPSASKR